MKRLQGTGACAGFAEGPVFFYRRATAGGGPGGGGETEAARLALAYRQADRQLEDLRRLAEEEAGAESAQIFEIHRMMLADEDFRQCAAAAVERGVSAEEAVWQAAEQFSALLEQTGDPLLSERAADVRDAARTLENALCGGEPPALEFPQPVILAAEDLSPSETVRLDKRQVLAFLTSGGTAQSHTAILARSLGIPAVVGLGPALDASWDGGDALVDGGRGIAVLSPDAEARRRFREGQALAAKEQRELSRFRDVRSDTRTGRAAPVCANVGAPGDLDAALESGAEGVGLFRTEFFYLSREQPPTEEEQFAAYREALRRMGGRQVVFRTLDAGSDKQAACLDLPAEQNPALGLRGLRFCLERPGLFRTQLRALYRAAAEGNAAIMFPMVASLWELQEAKAAARAVQDELRAEGLPFREKVPLGVMIETPAAAVLSADLAREADFFSIGTNDLTQYVLAADRLSPALRRFYDPLHPAVLALMRATVENAHRAGIPAGVCGEVAANPRAVPLLLEMGVDKLSVAPPSVLPVRAAVCAF